MGCNCQIPIVKRKLHELPSNYSHLGSGVSVNSIRLLFHRLSGLPIESIGVHELFWTSEVHLDQCRPYSKIFVPGKKEILTIFCTKQECRQDPMRVIAIWDRGILEPKNLERITHDLFHHIVRNVEFVPRGSTDEADLLCNCNPLSKRKVKEAKSNNQRIKDITDKFTGTKTFGCSKQLYGPVCKFSYIPKGQNCRKKFNLKSKPHGKDSDDPVMANLSHQLADIAGKRMQELAPDAFHNMLKHAEDAKDCQLGPETRVFGGVTLVSDYVAHPHKDAADFPLGVIALFSFRNFSITAQGQMHILVNYSLTLGGKPGVAFDLGNNSLFFEAAMHETHASSCFERPSGCDPSRVGLVFNRHACLKYQ